MQKKILIADDDLEMRETLTFLIENAGFKVIPAENGLEAVGFAAKELPDLIMLDIHMPKLDGLKACKEIKSNPLTKAIPIIMLTVEGSMFEINQAISYGAKTYITKPAKKEEILKIIKGAIGD